MPSHAYCRQHCRRLPPAHTRGSVLIVAAMISAIIAVALTSYIKVALNSMNLADRSYYQNAAINLAEIGIEEALYSFNRLGELAKTDPVANAWTPYGWTIAGDNSVSRTITPPFTSGPGITAMVKIHCSMHNPTKAIDRPKIISKATLTFPNGSTLSKFIEVTIRRRSLFPKGMVVKQTIRVDGGGTLTLDSWNSKDDDDPTTPMEPYSTANRTANATLATLSTTDNAIALGNGSIYGYVATPTRSDGTSPTIAKGPGAILSGDFVAGGYDPNRILNDFEVQTFPPIFPPDKTEVTNKDMSSITGGGSRTLPAAGDPKNASDGVYYYWFGVGTKIDYNGKLTIGKDLDDPTKGAKVVFVLVNHSGVDSVKLSGGDELSIETGSSLKIYTNGNLVVGGGSKLSNGNTEPSSCIFFGTATGSQTFDITGNGATAVSLYAPNADIVISGGGSGGDFYGALVGNTVRMTGTTNFHYDEALAEKFTGKKFGIAKWRELQTATERDVYAGALASF